MALKRFGFVGPAYNLTNRNADAQECINWFPLIDESGGGNAPIILEPGPGLQTFCNMTGGAPFISTRGGIQIDGRVFEVVGTAFNEVFSNGTFTNRGTVLNDQLPVTMAATPQQLLLASGGQAYVFTLNTNGFAALPADTFDGPVSQVAVCDEFFIATIVATKEFWVSGAANANDWTSNGSAIVSVFPDNIVGMLVDHREIWFWSDTATVVYYDSGNIFPFDVVPSSFIESGMAAKSSAAQLANTVMWLSQDARGAGQLQLASGYVPQRVSTFAIEQLIQSFPRIDDAVAFSYQENGHTFYVLTFPTASVTIAFDITTQLWHRRGYWVEAIGQYRASRYWNHVYAFGKHLVGDPQSGILYQMSQPVLNGSTWNFQTDNGNPIRRLRRAPHISNFQKYQTFHELQVYLESGIGPIPPLLNGQGDLTLKNPGTATSTGSGAAWNNPNNIKGNTPGSYTETDLVPPSVGVNIGSFRDYGAGQSGSSSVTINVTVQGQNISVGDLLLLQMEFYASAYADVSTITDTLSDVWAVATTPLHVLSPGNAHKTTVTWYAFATTAKSISSTFSITLNFSRTIDGGLQVCGFGSVTGIKAIGAGPISATGSSSGVFSSGSLTVPANSILFSSAYCGVDATANSPFTRIASTGTITSGDSCGLAYYIPSSGGSYADGWTVSGGPANYGASLVSFTLETGGGPVTSQTLTIDNYGFDLDADATILGIMLQLNGKQSATSTTLTVTPLTGGTPQTPAALAATDSSAQIGGFGNLMGFAEITPAMLNAPGFGFSIVASDSSGLTQTVDLSGAVLTVFWTDTSIARGPQVVLRWSKDGGHTWSNEQARDYGQAGNYTARARWQRLGVARDLVLELTTADPVPARIVDAYIDAEAGTGA